MLEERERKQDAGLQERKRTASRIMLGILACAVIGLLSLRDTRNLVVSLIQGKPAASAKTETASAPAKVDEKPLQRVADMVSKASGGKAVNHEDIEFGMELLNFMQTPASKAPASPAKPAGVE